MKSRALTDARLERLERIPKRLPENFPAPFREAIWACIRIVTHRDEFPELGSGRGQRRLLFGQRERERHLQRLEAMCLVLQVLLLHCELVDLRCGRRRSDGSCDAIRIYAPRPIKGRAPPTAKAAATTSIQKETGLRRTALGGALADLREAEFVGMVQPREKFCGDCGGAERGERVCSCARPAWKWRAWPAVHTIALLCFKKLGINLEWLQQQRDGASEQRRLGPQPTDNVPERRALRARQREQLRAAKRSRPPVDS